MAFVKISEQPSLYNDLEKKSVLELLTDINNEDKKVALAVEKAVNDVLDEGWRTSDIAGDIESVKAQGKLVGTKEMGSLIVEKI